MAYEWQMRECNPDVKREGYPHGLPYSKIANVTLEKDGELKTFLTQEATDAAWADGWHEPGRPETADVIEVAAAAVATADVPPEYVKPVINETIERLEKGTWPKKRGPGRPRKNG